MAALGRHRGLIIGGIVTAAVLVLGFFAVREFLSSPPPQRQKVVQEIALVRPPPPPPEPEEPPPPPPEIEEEVDVPEPTEEPDQPPSDEPPPSDLLGLDADGGAGSDAFGLVGNRGGRGLIAGGGGSRFRWYAGVLRQALAAHLSEYDAIRSRNYKVTVLIWLTDAGEVRDVALDGSTGEPELDIAIENALANLTDVGGRPPRGLPQPVTLQIVSRL